MFGKPAMDMFAVELLLLSVLSGVSSQTVTEDEAKCGQQTTINYVYGADNVQTPEMGVRVPSQLHAGPPGKSGAPGQKGQKGDAAGTAYLQSEMQMLKDRITTLERELEKRTLPLSCDYINGTETDSGNYLISPNPNFPFIVHCKFSGSIRETVIEHNSKAEVRINGCEPNYCYRRKITYAAALSQITALIQQSSNCKQYIKLRCNGVLFNHASGGRAIQWISRSGTPVEYWGGATSLRPGYCACGETGSCRETNRKCNCDSNKGPETSDEGFLTDKNTLPVMEVQIGDNGDNSEIAWHSLGPLICSGRA
ncbi:unnamed protein product [Clavelina lepadiformis]|uniref:Contactin-associated protein-like 2 n=1 Tax=Clavelina lepadiformis TaxID=159417 RepID=A0ABP0FSD2_CLALP